MKRKISFIFFMICYNVNQLIRLGVSKKDYETDSGFDYVVIAPFVHLYGPFIYIIDNYTNYEVNWGNTKVKYIFAVPMYCIIFLFILLIKKKINIDKKIQEIEESGLYPKYKLLWNIVTILYFIIPFILNFYLLFG